MIQAMSGAEATAVHGWGCTPTTEDVPKSRLLPFSFVRTWQRTALYAILIVLLVLIFLNLALSMWIIASLRLSMKSIGPIKMINGGIQIDGQAYLMDRLMTSSITSRPGQPLTLHSHRNFTILVSDPDLQEHSSFTIKRDRMECGGREFSIVDGRGNGVFKASREEVRMFTDSLILDGIGGVNVKSAVQAQIIRAPPGSDLELESQTRRLALRAPQSITLESRAGNIDITSHSNIHMESTVGALKIEAQNIYLTDLKQAKIGTPSSNKHSKPVKVYQLCVCAKSGKMFLAAADGICAAHSDDIDLCR